MKFTTGAQSRREDGNRSISPLCLDGFNPKGEVKMLTRMAFWRMIVTIAFVVVVLAEPLAGQSGRKDPEPEEATRFDYSTSHAFPGVFSPYMRPFVPRPRLDNSPRLQDLISNGKLVLTLEDAIALALENNLDVEVARYNLPIAQTDYLRTKGGGAARGAAGSFRIHHGIFRRFGRGFEQ